MDFTAYQLFLAQLPSIRSMPEASRD